MHRLSSISSILVGATVIFILLLAAIFADAAKTAFVENENAARTLTVVELKRGLFKSFECARTELGMERAIYDASDRWDATPIENAIAAHRECDGIIGRTITTLRRQTPIAVALDLALLHRRYDAYKAGWPIIAQSLKQPRGSAHQTGVDLRWAGTIDALTGEMDRVSKMLSARHGTDAFIDDVLGINDILWNVRGDAGMLRRYMGDALQGAGASLSQLRQMDKISGQLDARWEMLSDKMRSPDVTEALRQPLRRTDLLYFHRYAAWREHMIESLRAGQKPFVSRAGLLEVSGPSVDSISAASMVMLDATADRARMLASETRAHLRVSIWMMVASTILAVCAGAYVLYRVVIPLKRIAAEMDLVARGGAIAHISYQSRGDEIGQLARSLRHFRDSAVAQREMEVELVRNQAAKEIAERSSRNKSAFIASMSHELRTPLNAILGFSEIISHGMPEFRERQQEYAKNIHVAGSHLLELVNDILDISKAEAGKLELHPEEVNLGELLNESCGLVRSTPSASDVGLEVSSATVPAIWADRLRIKQVVLNLLTNAVKFTPSGGAVQARVECTVDGGVALEIADTGIGISAEDLKKIFEPFHQIDSAYTRRHDGTGLGLAIVSRIVEMHEGKIGISSVVGQGTTVTVTFPKSRVLEAEQAARAACA